MTHRQSGRSNADFATILPFSGGGECPVQYLLDLEGREYYIRYRWGLLSVDVDDVTCLEAEIGGPYDGFLSDEETTVYLWEISRAIRAGTLGRLALPRLFETRSHALYVTGPLPHHAVGLACGK